MTIGERQRVREAATGTVASADRRRALLLVATPEAIAPDQVAALAPQGREQVAVQPDLADDKTSSNILRTERIKAMIKKSTYFPGSIGVLLCAGLISGATVFAQGPLDAYRNNLLGTHGTARAQGLAGAVGAVGADPTAVYVNPAGLAYYSSSAFSLTLDPGFASTPTQWSGYGNSESQTLNYSRFGLANISYMSPIFQNYTRGSILNINLGFSYDRSYDYKRNYSLITGILGNLVKDPNGNPRGIGYDLTDYIAARANDAGLPHKKYLHTDTHNPFLSNLDPLVTMGINGFLIEGYGNGDESTHFRTLVGSQFIPNGGKDKPLFRLPPAGSLLTVNESGGKHDFDLSAAMTVGDYIQLGASLRMGSLHYTRSSSYRQDYHWDGPDYKGEPMQNRSYMVLNNSLQNDGGYLGLNLGVIVALGEYGRLGISYLTPQYLHVNESYSASVTSFNGTFGKGDELSNYETEVMESSYNMLMPGQLTLSALGLLGKFGLISYDFMWRNLGAARLFQNGEEMTLETDAIREDYGNEMTHRIGIEILPMARVALRGGFSYTGCPLKAEALRSEPSEGLIYNPLPSGTIPDFTLARSYTTYSGGLGYRLTRRLGMDLTYVRAVRSEKVYPFSGYAFDQEGTQQRMTSFGGDLKDIQNNFVLTFSYQL